MLKTVITILRCQPPTKAHEMIIQKVEGLAEEMSARPFVFLSKSEGSSKNPLPYSYKLELMKSCFGDIFYGGPEKEVVGYLKFLNSSHYSDISIVCGSDRKYGYEMLLKNYNHKDFNFNVFQVISEYRTDKSISGTKMRQFAVDNDWESFFKNLPSTLRNDAEKARILYSYLQELINR